MLREDPDSCYVAGPVVEQLSRVDYFLWVDKGRFRRYELSLPRDKGKVIALALVGGVQLPLQCMTVLS
jgi:hypothetical protein